MTRDIVLGNQSLLVNIDRWLQVRDIYYPRVGQENHVQGHPHRIGVFTDGLLNWIGKEDWDITPAYKDESLVTKSRAIQNSLELELAFNECVYCIENVFIRRVVVKNRKDSPRVVKVFFAQDFHLYGTGFGDTALYQGDRNILVHYKKSRYFLINILRSGNKGPKGDIDDYAIGAAEWQGKDGTYRDAEDGVLSKNPIAQGSIDSTVAITLEIKAKGEEEFYYIFCAGKDFHEVFRLNDLVLEKGPKELIRETEKSENMWVNKLKTDLSLVGEDVAALYKRSLLIIKTQMDRGGAIIAANDSDNMEFNMDTYSYMWPRDGALVAMALIKAGFADLTKPFFLFCSKLLWNGGYLLHKYNPDGTLGSSWHAWVENGEVVLPIQEDETALVIAALWEYFKETRDIKFINELYKTFIKPAADFMISYRYENGLPQESYDLWEERKGVFTFTASAVYAGLRGAEKLGELYKDNVFCKSCASRYDEVKSTIVDNLFDSSLNRFIRGIRYEEGDPTNVVQDKTLDSSVFGLFQFGVLPPHDPKVVSTMEAVKDRLWVRTDVGGVARYENDKYHQVSKDVESVPGNPWFISTLWLAKWYIAKANSLEELSDSYDLIKWTVDHSLSTGMMPEQLDPYSGAPLSVSPLTWSHAEFVDTVTSYVEKKRVLLKK